MRVFRAPGRVNLVGDHTDYNDGLVLPIAIQLETHVAISPRAERVLLLRSDGVAGEVQIDLDRPLAARSDWTDYVVGVAHVLMEAGHRISGATLVVSSALPQGAGLSSSAALEVASAFAFLDGNVGDRVRVAKWCQRAENAFVGARCGIMDQYIACLARAGHALVIDCRTLESRPVRVPPEVTVVVANTMVKHSIAAGEYNVRRQECEEAVRLLAPAVPEVRALRDVTLAELNADRELLPSTIFRRARHVITENARVTRLADALDRHDFAGCGELMNDSHESLRNDFEVSTPELNLMVALARKQPGVYGSRMTGGGFGGSTVTLVASSFAAALVEQLRRDYARESGMAPGVHTCMPADGAGEVTA